MNHRYPETVEYNRRCWNQMVEQQNRWTIPVNERAINEAREGKWEIVLTPNKPVPKSWFPEFDPRPKILCLASGGGQQAPILAAAGAEVTVFDNSESQLEQDRKVADRDQLDLKTERGDMADLSRFDSEFFDSIFHPCSNCFAADIRPVWRECFRVLKPGGTLLAGFTNPIRYIFDDECLQNGDLKVVHKIPYSDIDSIGPEQQQHYIDQHEPISFGHSLTDQIGGQLDAGLRLIGFYEDRYESDDVLSEFIDSFIATRALKPNQPRD